MGSAGHDFAVALHGHESVAEAELDPHGRRTLDELEARRVDWRAKRDNEEVSLTELMPLHTPLEERWAYFVPQPIPDDAVEHAAESALAAAVKEKQV